MYNKLLMEVLLAPFYRWRQNVRNWVMSQNRKPFHTLARHQSVVIAKVEVFNNEQSKDLGVLLWNITCIIVRFSAKINNDLCEELRGRVLSHNDWGHSQNDRLISMPWWSSAWLSSERRAYLHLLNEKSWSSALTFGPGPKVGWSLSFTLPTHLHRN